jgi:DNA-binding MarR family transcriptional regulator
MSDTPETNNPETKTGLRSSESQSTTRLLLALWELGAHKSDEVKRVDLTEKIKRTGEKASDYQSIFDKLEQEGAIAFEMKNRNRVIYLTEKGVQLLGESLNNPEFEFDSQIGARTANALLRWMREMASSGTGVSATVKEEKVEGAIASYDEFKSVALAVYDKLNSDYNLDNLVPIYRIRREVGSRVNRSQFNDWLLEMQTNDIFQLIGGEMPGITPEQVEDSIKTKIGGVRYYAKRL